MAYLLLGTTSLLTIVFGISSWSKLHSSPARLEFSRSVRTWGLLPDRFAGRAAAALAGSESVAAALLAATAVTVVADLGPHRMLAGAALTVTIALLMTLTSGLVVLLRRGVSGRCACFGAGESQLRPLHVGRNSVLLGAAALGLIAAATAPTSAVSLAGAVVTLGVSAAVAMLIIHLDEVVDLFAPTPPPSVRRPSSPAPLVPRS